jgi:hypothetical protein
VAIRLPVTRVAEGKDAKVRLGKARLDGLVPRGIRVFSETIRVSWMSRSEDKKENRRPLGHRRSRPRCPAEARSDANVRCFGWDSPHAVHEAFRPVRRHGLLIERRRRKKKNLRGENAFRPPDVFQTSPTRVQASCSPFPCPPRPGESPAQ